MSKKENSKKILLIGEECCNEQFVRDSLGAAIEYPFEIKTFNQLSPAHDYLQKKNVDLINFLFKFKYFFTSIYYTKSK